MMHHNRQKGFTLLELLIVVAILAILASVVVFALNPTEMLKKARDAQRIADLAAFKSALVLYQEEVVNANIGAATCVPPAAGADPTCLSTKCTQSSTYGTCTTGDPGQFSPVGATDGGWIPDLDFSGMSPTPISKFPVDPTNNATYHYSYAVDSNGNFELDAKLESTYYTTTINADGKDGGDDPALYEVGTLLTIISP